MVRAFFITLCVSASAVAHLAVAADAPREPTLREEIEDRRTFREETTRWRQDDEAARRFGGMATGKIIMDPTADHTALIIEVARVDPDMAIRLHTFWQESRAAILRREALDAEEAAARAIVEEILADPFEGRSALHQMRDNYAEIVRLAAREVFPEGLDWEWDFLEDFERAARAWRAANPKAPYSAFRAAMRTEGLALVVKHTHGQITQWPEPPPRAAERR